MRSSVQFLSSILIHLTYLLTPTTGGIITLLFRSFEGIILCQMKRENY
jgi:hypothetical protein